MAVSKKQGIVTILGSDCERNRAASIRRTLSADMSSKKWLEQNGFLAHVKKIASFEELVTPPDLDSSSSEGEEEECEPNMGQDDVWRSIQSQNQEKELNSWGTILTEIRENHASNVLQEPYVHPLVRRSASALSERSLEICTESLGSETGSDCFSSEILSDVQRKVQECVKEVNPIEDLHVVKKKNSPVRPFPPPLSFISGEGGASFYMNSHRENGRLVLEAVAVSPRKCFRAQRGEGRLVLTLIDHFDSQESEVVEKKEEEFEEVFGNMEVVDGIMEDKKLDGGGDHHEEEVEREEVMGEAKEEEFFMDQNSKSLPSGIINAHKHPLLMKKFMGLGNKNKPWSIKFNKAINLTDVEEMGTEKESVKELPIPQSLPPRPPVARLIPSPPLPPPATLIFNAYDYLWQGKTTPQATPVKNNRLNRADQEMVAIKGDKTEYFAPYYLRGCNKEPRRSLLIWEPCCIATS